MSSPTTAPAPVSPTPSKNTTSPPPPVAQTPPPTSPTPTTSPPASTPPSSSPPPPTAPSPSSSTSPPPPKSFTSPPPPTTHSSSSPPPPPPKTSNGSNTPSSTGTTNSSSFSTTAIVGVAVAGVVGVLLLCILIACCCRKKRKRRPELLPVQYYGAPPQPSKGIGRGISRTFTYEDLHAATNGFSQTNRLGVGAFGCVYKGILPGGKTIAVKKLKASGSQGEGAFQAEGEIIRGVHHRHLVSLVGYCIAGSHRLLVYEFVPNDTLEHHLHDKGQPTMDWPTRLKIATGAARGLAYLHEDCCPKIIHRDIKASNILLDSNFEAKVADFGLAKLVSESFTHVSTRVAGTFGYLAPEYASTGKLTDKSDVYSFGALLLELITGCRPVHTPGSVSEEGLVQWARPLLARAREDGNVGALADSRLQHKYNVDEMMRVVKCAASCVRRSARKRPRMGQIVHVLEGDVSLDNLDEGVRPGHSTVYGSIGSSDYDTNQHSEDMKKLRKMALGSQEHGRDYSGAASEYGFSSGEHLQDPRTVRHYRSPSSTSVGSDYSGATSEYGLNQSVSANMDDYSGGRPQYCQNNAPQPGDNAVKIHPPSSPPSHPVIPKPPPSGSKQPLPPPSPGIGLGIPRTFTIEDLEAATNGFSRTKLLGQGGSGHVYEGILPGGKTIAVKQLKVGGSQREHEFQKFEAEVDILRRVHHRHVVSLVGYCIAGSQRLLVYEFCPNDTLEHHLHGEGQVTMDLRTRLKIATGAARGLAYLHEDCHPKIIHRDIKASTILLDSKYQAKVTGLGLAKLVSEHLTNVLPMFISSTSRFVAPEDASTDVYSFGVLLLELITGRRHVDTTPSSSEVSLVDWARPLLEDGNVDALADIRVQQSYGYNVNEMMRLVKCAASCVRHSARKRPRMGQIVHVLEGVVSPDDLD